MNVALIPARGGSKRVPGKNMMDYFGQPIITHVINNCRASMIFDYIYVSSDDDDILDIARHYEVDTHRRTDENSSDTASLSDVVLEFVSHFGHINNLNIFLILPTSALIDSETIRNSYIQFHDVDSLISVAEYQHPIQRAFKQKNGYMKLINKKHEMKRTQDLEKTFYDAGQFYWLNIQSFMKQKKIFMKYSSMYLLGEYDFQDIDYPEDALKSMFKFYIKNKMFEKIDYERDFIRLFSEN